MSACESSFVYLITFAPRHVASNNNFIYDPCHDVHSFYTNVEEGKHSNDDTDCAFMLIQFFYDQHSITSKNNINWEMGDKK